MNDSDLGRKAHIASYYSNKLKQFGTTPQGVDWKSEEAQTVRFAQVSKVLPNQGRFLIGDVGCGYGALYDYLKNSHQDFEYIGFDWSAEMIQAATEKHAGMEACNFKLGDLQESVDFAIGSGIFNVTLGESPEHWKGYVLQSLAKMNQFSSRGFAFNLLSLISDPDKRSNQLFYAAPSEILNHCLQNFSSKVALLHDYGLYEFTVLVRKD